MNARTLLGCLALLCSAAVSAQASGPTAAPGPGFDCRQAQRVVEHWICADHALMQADQRLNASYRTALAKPDGDAARAAVRAGQLRWLRQRNRCDSPDCVAAAYAQRTAELQTANHRVRVLDGEAFAPVFSRVLPYVNDTRAVSGILLRRAEPTAFEVVLTIDPDDAGPWREGGPGVRMACWPPDRQEGYASRFQYAAHSWGDAFRPVEQAGRPGFVLLRFVVGRDLPLNEDILCTVALTEWLLDQPSQLHLLQSPP
ncbi:lysozyme inhibitor LprI family protein [Pulveribacter sp.]|uniref:lysozyme inhibitor LprI family protein n=1 Tax=Pulveribacter sp. TaxID=2678893 RepID=UPI0028AA40EC|nr:lysozyme inhibitor LprI family protein [Pulveribacter sp.]